MAHNIEAILQLKDNMSATLQVADSNVKKFGKSMKSQGRALKDFGRTVGYVGKDIMKLNAPFLALGGWATKLGIDFEAVTSEAQAVMGATKSEMDAFKNKAREVGGATSKSAKESMEGIKLLGQAGLEQKEILDLTYPLVRLSEAGNLDMARSADLLTNSMKSAEIPMKNVGQYLDQIALAGNESNTSIEQQLEAWNSAGGAISSANMKMSEANALFGILANRGVKAGEAGNTVSRIFQNLNATTGEAGKAMKKLGIETSNSDGSMRNKIDVLKELKSKTDNMTESQREQYLTMIGGKAHTENLKKMLAGLGDEYDSLESKLANADGALEKMAITMKDNLKGKLETLSSASEEFGLKLADMLIPRVEKVVDKVQAFVDALNNLDKKQLDTIISLVLFTTKLALVLIALGSVTGIIGKFQSNFGDLIGMFSAGGRMSRFFGLSGLKLVGVLGLIIFTIIQLIKRSDSIGPALKNTLVAVKDFLSKFKDIIHVFDGLKKTISNVFDGLAQTVKGALQVIEGILRFDGALIKEGLINIFKGGVKVVKNLWRGLIDVLSIPIEAIVILLKGSFPKTAKVIEAIWSRLKRFLKHPIKTTVELKDFLKGKVKGVLSSIKNLKDSAKETIKVKVTTAVKDFKKGMKDTKKSILDLKDNTKEEIKVKAKLLAKKFPKETERLKKAWKDLKDTFSEKNVAVAELKDNARSQLEKLKETYLDTKKELKEKIKPHIEVAKSQFEESLEGVKKAWKDFKDSFKGKPAKAEVHAQAGKVKGPDIEIDTGKIEELKESLEKLKPVIEGIKNAFKGLGLAIIAGFVTGVIGVIEGFIVTLTGIVEFVSGIVTLVSGIITGDTEQMMEGLKGIFQGGVTFIKGLWQGLVSIITIPAEAVVRLLEGIFPEKAEKIREIWEKVKHFLKNPGEAIASLIDLASSKMKTVRENWSKVISALKNTVKGKVEAITGAFHRGIDNVREKWKKLREFLRHPIQGTVSLVQRGASWVKGKVGKNWQGTSNWRGGPTYLHEKGGEIFDLPGGTRVYPHDKSVEMARREGENLGSRSTILNIPKLADQIIVREEADIERIADKLATKIEDTKFNMA